VLSTEVDRRRIEDKYMLREVFSGRYDGLVVTKGGEVMGVLVEDEAL
jgi:hypothetical protein